MDPSPRFGALGDSGFQVLWEDGERTLCRTGWPMADGGQSTVLVAQPTAEHPSSASLERLAHEYRLRDQLDSAWAARPLELVREGGRTLLLLEDPGGEPLAGLLTAPFETGRFLRLAISIVTALRKVHQHGLIHKDLKPANILVSANGEVRFTGFGIASRLPRERQAPEPPETIAGTLAYMAPEQTGRMNRSIDARSDLYALGVTLYQMLTGALPFTAADPMEWVHCHIARKPVPPSERSEKVPAPVSAHHHEAACQDRRGALSDRGRRRVRSATVPYQWEAHGRNRGPFPLGQARHARPVADSRKALWPRARDRDPPRLLRSHGEHGPPELVLVAGYSGIGKSSVVNELHKVLVPPRGLFAAGKFDQYKRDIPYATLGQAFPKPRAAAAQQERGRAHRLARRTAGGARPERTTHGRCRPGAEVRHRRAAAGP